MVSFKSWLFAGVFVCLAVPGVQAQGVGYKLSPQDVIEISVWQHEDLSRILTIESDGTISYPLAGQIEAGGQTVNELTAELIKRISKYIPNPQVTVTVREYRGLSVTVMGKVRKPGHYPIMGGRNLLDILAEAGGLEDSADISCVRVLRAGTNHCVNLKPVLKGRAPLEFDLEPADMIYVPKKWWAWVDTRDLQMALTLTVIVLQIIQLSR